MDYRTETLSWVNKVRDRLSIGPPLDALPVGIPDSMCDCPIARALKADVTRTEVRWGFLDDGPYEECVPVFAAEFIRAFDELEYDDLVDWDKYHEALAA